MRTGTARREASCACVVLVIKLVKIRLGGAPRGGRNFEDKLRSPFFDTKEFTIVLLCHVAVSSE